MSLQDEPGSCNTATEVGSSVKLSVAGLLEDVQIQHHLHQQKFWRVITMKLFPQEATLREHSTCSSMDWNLSWVPPGNQDLPLATDRGKEASYWTAGETCQKRSQKEKTDFPRKLTAAVSTALMRSGELTAPEAQLLSPFSQYTQVITAHTSSQYILHQS